MTRKFKALGLAFFAVLAMGAVMASAASATEFTASGYPVEYTGNQAAGAGSHVFTADGYTTTCTKAHFRGSATGPTTTATLIPTYEGCTAFGLEAIIDMNGCDYTIHLPAGSATHVQAGVSLKCETGKDVTITAGGGLCVAHVTPFSTPKNHVTVTNGGGGVTGQATVAGIEANLTDVGGFFCPFSGNTEVNNATYTGHLVVTGLGGKSVSISG